MDNSQIENTINEIRKRSGTVTVFNKDKISNAIFRALAATSKADRSLADQLTNNVVNKLVEQGFTSSRTPTVEDIQDIVE
ncbi:MAG: ATP cone domain-containing protein, partial [Nitrosopumilus sp.]